MILRDSWFGNKLHELYRKYLIVGDEYISGGEFLKRRLIFIVLVEGLILVLEFGNLTFDGIANILVSLIGVAVAEIVLFTKRSFSAGFGTLATAFYISIALFSNLVFVLVGNPLDGFQTNQLENELQHSLVIWAIFCSPVVYAYGGIIIFTNSL